MLARTHTVLFVVVVVATVVSAVAVLAVRTLDVVSNGASRSR